MIVRPLEIGDENAFITAMAEWERDAEAEYDFAFDFSTAESYAIYLAKITGWSRGENLPGNFVPCTFLVGVLDDGHLTGRISIRHELTESLLRVGGHIGYMVLPQFRRQGVGTALLREAILYTRQLGVDRILVTCDEDNIGSRKIIEANGGIYENSAENADLGQPKRRYWIEAD